MLNFITIIAGVMIGTLLAGIVTFVVMLYTPLSGWYMKKIAKMSMKITEELTEEYDL